jgi:hypothetical protein
VISGTGDSGKHGNKSYKVVTSAFEGIPKEDGSCVEGEEKNDGVMAKWWLHTFVIFMIAIQLVFLGCWD